VTALALGAACRRAMRADATNARGTAALCVGKLVRHGLVARTRKPTITARHPIQLPATIKINTPTTLPRPPLRKTLITQLPRI
jgi:hypothetical protein